MDIRKLCLGYNTDFYTFAAYNNGNTNDWTQTMCTTLQGNNNMAWIYCGFYTKNDAQYFIIAALNMVETLLT
ncbi:MAG: hypothetical protein FWH37_04680 [Candidatus Bathyarchaeota archaeon]|nr:hypothetical protein [Candidatus Termiticorpusculum sp.]